MTIELDACIGLLYDFMLYVVYHAKMFSIVAASLLAVARAGAGTNNVPIDALGKLGVPVFNTPGANANAVKELVLAGMLLAARNICQGWQYTQSLEGDDETINATVEKNKKQFVGFELPAATQITICS